MQTDTDDQTGVDEEERQEEIAAIIGGLSAIDTQLQQVEKTAADQSRAFQKEAEQSETPTSPQFRTARHLLQELRGDVHKIREYIRELDDFLRSGTYNGSGHHGLSYTKESGRLEQTQIALEKAADSFQKTSNALHVVGRALKSEEMETYADHVQNLSESVEAEAQRAWSALESSERTTSEDPSTKSP